MHKLASGALWAAFILIVGCNPVAAQTGGQSTATPGLVINEILAHTDPPQQDAVELYNPTATAIDISAWILADNNNAEQRYVIPSGTILPAGAYQVIPLDDGAPFRLSEFGETVFLFQPGAGDAPGPLVDRARFGVSPNGVSFGPITLSTGEVHQVLLQTPTLGASNALPRIGPLVIDELMPRPIDGRTEYVAIRNVGALAAPLCDLAATGLPAILRMGGDAAFRLPCGPLLESGDRLFIARATPAEFRQQYGISADVLVVGPFSGRLSNEGELVEIVWPQPPETDGSIAYFALDQVDYAATAPWPVLASDGIALVRRDPTAYGDDPANWRAANEAPLTRRVWLPWVRK